MDLHQATLQNSHYWSEKSQLLSPPPNCAATVVCNVHSGYMYQGVFYFVLLQWYMVTLVHTYNRWKNSEISCYVNGELASYGDIAWFVNTSDVSSRNNSNTVFAVCKYT